MYYSENTRKKKVKELENNKEFMDYAHKNYNERVMTFGADTFDKYLLKDVFVLYDNFTMIKFLETSDQKTIDKVLDEALKGLRI